ncbi:MAG TPA: hypothetical protein VNE22_03600 [Acidimicrobiales bacterium]|nr:hypothetical protein [Acidimicrobiales bacterium]
MSLAAVVPLRDFSLAKVRLRSSGVVDVTTLARDLAAGVLTACRGLATFVVTESDDVEAFALEQGVRVLRSDVHSLNGAVHFAYARLASAYDQLMVVHGDLKFPAGLDVFVAAEDVTVITDDQGDGTNVLVLPTGYEFRFGYGSNSAQRHAREAIRLGLSLSVVTDSPWRYDVDEATDL